MSTWTACLGGRGLDRGRRLYLVTVSLRSGDMDTAQSGQLCQLLVMTVCYDRGVPGLSVSTPG
jgi:hypothetical protein